MNAMLWLKIDQTLALAALPHNVRVSETGRGSGGETHPSDVVVLVKRFAADEQLAQDRGIVSVFQVELVKCIIEDTNMHIKNVYARN